jgi:hypothetical protein
VSIAYGLDPGAVPKQSTDSLATVKARPMFVFLAALLAFAASSPSASAHGLDAVAGNAEVCVTPRSARGPGPEPVPELRLLPGGRRSSVAVPDAPPPPDPGNRQFTLVVRDTTHGATGLVETIDAGADGHRAARVSSGCLGRGPPGAA